MPSPVLTVIIISSFCAGFPQAPDLRIPEKGKNTTGQFSPLSSTQSLNPVPQLEIYCLHKTESFQAQRLTKLPL